MKVSDINYDLLSDVDKYNIIMSQVKDIDSSTKPFDATIILGCSPRLLYDRVLKANELYNNNLCDTFILSGNCAWQKLWKMDEARKLEFYNDIKELIGNNILIERCHYLYDLYVIYLKDKYPNNKYPSWNDYLLNLKEANLMFDFINELGTFNNANIIMEPYSNNTPENAKNSKLLLEYLGKNNLNRIAVITISWHVRRSYLTFKKYFPNSEIVVIPSTNDLKRKNTFLNSKEYYDYFKDIIFGEVEKIIKYSRNGSIEDMDLDDFLEPDLVQKLVLKK